MSRTDAPDGEEVFNAPNDLTHENDELRAQLKEATLKLRALEEAGGEGALATKKAEKAVKIAGGDDEPTGESFNRKLTEGGSAPDDA